MKILQYSRQSDVYILIKQKQWNYFLHGRELESMYCLR